MITDCKKMIEHICHEIRMFTDIAVLGTSGGADSTLVAILCAQSLGANCVYAVSMPYDNNKDINTYNFRSGKMAKKLRVNHLLRPIKQIADAIEQQIKLHEGNVLSAINKGNARARARMCILYGLAYTISEEFPSKRVRVIGTGNLSEAFIGYCTKGGDAVADIFPIGELFKSEVYQLLDYYRDNGIIDEEDIDRVPTAGLWDGQTDECELGWSYNEIEEAIRYCLEHCNGAKEGELSGVIEFVWNRHKANKHKLSEPKIIKTRMFCK